MLGIMTLYVTLQEVLTDACSKTGTIDQKAILYLNKCFCGLKFCMERALRVQSCLKRIKLEYCATEVSIKYALPSYLFHHIAVSFVEYC